MPNPHACPNDHPSHVAIVQTDRLTWIMEDGDANHEIEYCPYCGSYLMGRHLEGH